MNSIYRLFLGIIACALIVSANGCRRGTTESASTTITIGSKNFTEQLIIGELLAQVIETNTDLEVKRMFNLGGTMICHEGLARGQLDIYAEYTGTALTAILDKAVITDPDKAFEVVAAEYGQQGLAWLKPFGFNNTYAITVRSDAAEKNGWKTISDLKQSAGELTAGFTSEFMERPDGYPGLNKAYAFTFGDTRDMEPSLMYQAVAQESVDVICAFATDGRIAAYNLTMLKDDKNFFPPYYAAPVVRQETLDQHPKLRKVLEQLGGLIDDTTMREMNNAVDQDKRDPAEVVSEFLKSIGTHQEAVQE
jgi:glycine betaine/choline ABC-type transport system substrate-binding protein